MKKKENWTASLSAARFRQIKDRLLNLTQEKDGFPAAASKVGESLERLQRPKAIYFAPARNYTTNIQS